MEKSNPFPPKAFATADAPCNSVSKGSVKILIACNPPTTIALRILLVRFAFLTVPSYACLFISVTAVKFAFASFIAISYFFNFKAMISFSDFPCNFRILS